MNAYAIIFATGLPKNSAIFYGPLHALHCLVMCFLVCSFFPTYNAVGQIYILDEQFSSAPALPVGFSGTGTFGSNASVNNFGRNAPSLQFLTDGQKLTFGPWANAADVVSFYHKSNGGGGSIITVEESTDGLTWTLVGNCTIITTSATWQGILNASSRYLRLSFTLVGGSKPYIDDLRIRNAVNACTGNFELQRVLINGNCAQCEDANEFVDFFTGDQPLDIRYFELVNPYVVPVGAIGGAYGGNGPADNANVNWGLVYSPAQLDYINNLNLLAGCNVFQPAPTGGIIPANSRVIAITGSAPDATYILTDMCGLGNVYVIFSTRNICPTGSGKYANASCSSNCSRYLSIFNHLTGCYDVRAYIASPTSTVSGALYVFEGPLIGYVGNISCLALALPSHFLNFSAWRSDNENALNWTVQEDHDVVEYKVQRSFDQLNFETVDIIQSNMQVGVADYVAYDKNPGEGLLHYYRIVMRRDDGSEVFSDVIAVGSGADWYFSLEGNDGILVKSPADGMVEVLFYDLTGKIIREFILPLQEGVNHFADTDLPRGLFAVIAKYRGAVVSVQRIVRE